MERKVGIIQKVTSLFKRTPAEPPVKANPKAAKKTTKKVIKSTRRH